MNLISQLQFVSNMFSCQNKVLTHAKFPLKLVSRFKFIQVLKAFEVIELQYLKFTLVPESGLCGMAERRLLNDLMEYYQVSSKIVTRSSSSHTFRNSSDQWPMSQMLSNSRNRKL